MSTHKYKITICIPCFGRPARTRRIINQLLSQTVNGWEAFVIGDGCPLFETLIASGEADYFKKVAEKNGNKLHINNLEKNTGNHGTEIINFAVLQAKGEFFVFAGNDDQIARDHFEHYLSEIENTNLDLVYYTSFVCPTNSERVSELKISCIGHSECIYRTDKIRDIKHRSDVYAHDWYFLEEFLSKDVKTKRAKSTKYTYIVMHTPGITCDKID